MSFSLTVDGALILLWHAMLSFPKLIVFYGTFDAYFGELAEVLTNELLVACYVPKSKYTWIFSRCRSLVISLDMFIFWSTPEIDFFLATPELAL